MTKAVCKVQAVQAKLIGVQEASGVVAAQSPNPRILVLRESGDVEVNVDLGDRENTPDGSFVRTVTHRHISTSSSDEHEDDRGHKAHSKGELCSVMLLCAHHCILLGLPQFSPTFS